MGYDEHVVDVVAVSDLEMLSKTRTPSTLARCSQTSRRFCGLGSLLRCRQHLHDRTTVSTISLTLTLQSLAGDNGDRELTIIDNAP